MKAIPVLPDAAVLRRAVAVRFDEIPYRTLWTTMLRPDQGRPPFFSPGLLDDLSSIFAELKTNDLHWPARQAMEPVQYVVLASEHPDYFNVGGDLAHFHDCISKGDRQNLRSYSRRCADMLFGLSATLGDTVTTIALVQGRALGGGFETSLAADYIVAEEQSEFGFPEILFGLFPCTGGMSLLTQRVGVRRAERMLADGRMYSADELKGLGLVDAVCKKGEGHAAIHQLIASHAKQRTARLMLQRSRRRLAPLDLAELHAVVEEWTEAAMSLGSTQLRVMEMLARMQRRVGAG